MAGLIQREERDTYFLTEVRQTKEVCNRAVTYRPPQARIPRAQVLPFWSKNDMDSVNKTFYLAPNLKMVGRKKVANNLKSIWHHNIFCLFLQKKVKKPFVHLHNIIMSFFWSMIEQRSSSVFSRLPRQRWLIGHSSITNFLTLDFRQHQERIKNSGFLNFSLEQ